MWRPSLATPGEFRSSSGRPEDEWSSRDDPAGEQAQGEQARLANELAAVMAAVDAGIITAARNGRVFSLNDAAVQLLNGPIDHLEEFLGALGWNAEPEHDELATVELQTMRNPDAWLSVTRRDFGPHEPAIVLLVYDVTDTRMSRGLREAFLGMLSHELRTPVTTIHAAAKLMTSGRLDPTEVARAGLIEDVADESDRLLRLVEDLLVLAHFDEGIDLVQEPSLLQRSIPPVIERERRRWPRTTIDVQIEANLPVVVGDETAVQQVVRNLIANAARYGGEHPVVVELSSDPGEGGVVVQVKDEGPGIDPEEAEALFRPFYRSSRTVNEPSGAGIGLYVCRQLVTAMGGRIWARSIDGAGSEFAFWLPAYEHEPDDGEPGHLRRPHGATPPVAERRRADIEAAQSGRAGL